MVWALSNIQRPLHHVSAVLLEVTEAATGGVLQKNVFLEISQNSQENTCAKVSFLTKLKAFSEHLRTTASKVSSKFRS